MAYVYRHIRHDKNEPFYIGVGTDIKYDRARERARRSDFWKKIVAKTTYSIEIIFDGVDFETAKNKEKEFIKLYGRKDLGSGCLVNMTDGGDGTIGKVFSDEYRKKLSDSLRGRVVTTEQRKKIADSHRGHRWTDEQKENLKKIRSGRKLSEEHINKISKRMIDKNPSRGKTGVMSKSFKGYIIAYKDGIFIGQYDGVIDCANKLNLTATKISACLNGRRNMTGGYTFKRIP